MNISVAHSPDADDFFLFWPLRTGLIDGGIYSFSFTELDTEELNAAAAAERFDICAISIAAYPKLAGKYAILTSGASVGRNYGPALVSRKIAKLEDLRGAKVGIPGKNTTAALLFSRLSPESETVEVPLTPFEEVFRRLDENELDAAVLIHEGQIAFAERGLARLADLGRWWFEKTDLPVPLGVNAVRLGVGEDAVRALAHLTEESARYAAKHRSRILPDLFELTQRRTNKLKTFEELERYLDMYANEDSLELRGDVREAIGRLLGEGCVVRYAE